jgi:hypothetical protein
LPKQKRRRRPRKLRRSEARKRRNKQEEHVRSRRDKTLLRLQDVGFTFIASLSLQNVVRRDENEQHKLKS